MKFSVNNALEERIAGPTPPHLKLKAAKLLQFLLAEGMSAGDVASVISYAHALHGLIFSPTLEIGFANADGEAASHKEFLESSWPKRDQLTAAFEESLNRALSSPMGALVSSLLREAAQREKAKHDAPELAAATAEGDEIKFC